MRDRLRWDTSVHCRDGVHCRLCRDREAGRAWRARLAALYAVPDDDVDWPCPRGRPWMSPDRGLGDTVEQVLDVTGVGPLAKRVIRGVTGKPCGCGRRRDRLNRLVPYPRRPA